MVWVPIFMVVHSTQVYILLKPLFSRHKGIGVQFTDEPTGNLDSASSETVMEYLQMINKDLKKAVVLVTHDAYVASFCDRVIFVKDGNIEVELRKKEKQDVFCDKIMKAQKDILKNK